MSLLSSALLCVAARGAPPTLRELRMTADTPLAACERCRDGDWLVHTGTLDVVVGTSHRRDESFYKFPTADALGSLLYLQPSGTAMRGDIMLGTPYLRVGNTTRHVAYERIDKRQSGDALTITAQGAGRGARGEQLRFASQYTFSADSARIDVSLQVTNSGPRPVRDLVYSLYFDPHQIYDFSPADDAAHAGLAFRGYPREGRLIGWLDRTARLSNDYNHSGWDGGMILPDPVAVSLAPGASNTRNYTLFA
ncbi:MAG TPA: hypothetical protein VFE85_01280, partial [Woeseiaceae bacterium]|nr:hypothetical protein [Woeseiaceae bacterium]